MACVCKVCGGPIRVDNKHGVCHRTAECRREHFKRRYATYYAKHPEKVRVKARRRYHRYAEKEKQRATRWKAANPDRLREHRKRYFKKHQWEIQNAVVLRRRIKGISPQRQRIKYPEGRRTAMLLDKLRNQI